MGKRTTLGVGLVGTGFIAGFHLTAFASVRDADIVSVYGPHLDKAETLAARARAEGLGEAKAYDDLRAMVQDPDVEAIWVLAPNYARLDVVETIVDEIASGRATLRGIAIEKPLAATLWEANRIRDLVESVHLPHAYLENQVYAPAITRTHGVVWQRGVPGSGSPYLARCAEEHAGPHAAWFWDGKKQGGGVLNDMMCHSVEAGRFLLTPPGKRPSEWLKPVSVQATIASLKWGRPTYATELRKRFGEAVDYTTRPSEDYARATFEFVNGDGEPCIIEATTSWSFVGAGMRLSWELLGPEYSLSANTLDTEGRVFLSRELSQVAGEEMLEKQQAEQGLLPVISDESLAYGYTTENQVICREFLAGRQPQESLDEGVEVVELLMAAYKAAEEGRTLQWPLDLTGFTPAVATGDWNPRAEGGRA